MKYYLLILIWCLSIFLIELYLSKKIISFLITSAGKKIKNNKKNKQIIIKNSMLALMINFTVISISASYYIKTNIIADIIFFILFIVITFLQIVLLDKIKDYYVKELCNLIKNMYPELKEYYQLEVHEETITIYQTRTRIMEFSYEVLRKNRINELINFYNLKKKEINYKKMIKKIKQIRRKFIESINK